MGNTRHWIGFSVRVVVVAIALGIVAANGCRRAKTRKELSHIERLESMSDEELRGMAVSGDAVAASIWGQRLFGYGFEKHSMEMVNDAGVILLDAAVAGNELSPQLRMTTRGNLNVWRNTMRQMKPGFNSIYHVDPYFRNAVDSFFEGTVKRRESAGNTQTTLPSPGVLPGKTLQPVSLDFSPSAFFSPRNIAAMEHNIMAMDMPKEWKERQLQNLKFLQGQRAVSQFWSNFNGAMLARRQQSLAEEAYQLDIDAKINEVQYQRYLLDMDRAIRMTPQYVPRYGTGPDGGTITWDPAAAARENIPYVPHNSDTSKWY